MPDNFRPTLLASLSFKTREGLKITEFEVQYPFRGPSLLNWMDLELTNQIVSLNLAGQ